MKMHEYLESTYVTTNLENQKEYSPYRQAHTNAAHNLITLQKSFYRWVSYPVLICGWLLVVCGLKQAPLSAREIAKKMQEDAKKAKENDLPTQINVGDAASIQ